VFERGRELLKKETTSEKGDKWNSKQLEGGIVGPFLG